MSAQPANPNQAPDQVNLEVDGKTVAVKKGAMIIEAADKLGVAIPRFCYHKKLPIAANCRMCLVDVEKAPKPMPACATPVMEGMKVYTQSKRALDSQRNVMEFLLINHPLDCPICDQGGECELQDVAMGYGRSVSRFVERKRVVADEDMGPLVATDMTRCIHCTRCVRFVGEVAGTYELGGINRGEHTEIGTYIGKSLESELSGNIVDVCPVGALTNKVFRFKARPWELIARESIGYHDALGSSLFLHTRRGEVLRTVPRDNEAVNECWLSDRDRYSHQGLYADDRATKPLVRKGGELVEVSWEEAIAFVADGLRAHAGADLAALVAPLASNEEGFLLGEIVRGLGSDAIDHRLRVSDFTDGAPERAFDLAIAEIENADRVLVVGGHPRLDQPLLGHRLHKAARRGARIGVLNPVDFDVNYDLAARAIVAPSALVDTLAAVARVAVPAADLPASLAGLVGQATVDDSAKALAALLADGNSRLILLGDFAVQHPEASLLRALANAIAAATGAALNEIPSGANGLGLARVGAQPRGAGHNAAQVLAHGSKALLTYHAGSQDTANPGGYDQARSGAKFHVYVGAFACTGVKRTAHAVLPIGLPPEIDGSYVNADGTVQQVRAGARLPGDARPGWRVLRALGAALGIGGFEFTEFAELAARVAPLAAGKDPVANGQVAAHSARVDGLERIATVPLYRSDAVVRRAQALQGTPLSLPAHVALHPAAAHARSLADGSMVKVSDGRHEAELPLRLDARVPKDAAWLPGGHSEVAKLRGTGAALTVTRVG